MVMVLTLVVAVEVVRYRQILVILGAKVNRNFLT